MFYLARNHPIFNRFDLSASNGQHCGEYRVIYHKNNGNRFFLSFEAKYPNPELEKGKAVLVLRIFVSVLASENFLSKSSLSTPVAPRLKTKALLLMSVDPLVSMVFLQKRAQEAALSELADNMSPTAIFNRFDLSASNGQHCGEYRVIYHKTVLNSLSCHGRSTNVLERT
jgi:hypothetical protein